MLKVKCLKAFNGDCILLTLVPKIGDEKRILIDSGTASTYKINKNIKKKPEYGVLKDLVDELRSKKKLIDLLILTHVDDDHIAGLLQWFKDDPNASELIAEVWFNSGALIAEYFNSAENPDLDPEFDLRGLSTNTSIRQGIKFGKYIESKGIWRREIFIQGKDVTWNGAEFRFLSPDSNKLGKLLKEWKKKEPQLTTSLLQDDYKLSIEELIANDKFEQDISYPNGSSIAFVLTFEMRDYLFLGDSHPSVIIEGLSKRKFSGKNKLKVELVKLSHHGSKGNTNKELLEMIDSNLYIVSTNGEKHAHPHKQLLARLISERPGCEIYFNYKERMEKIFLPEDFEYLPFTISYLPEEFEFKNAQG